MSWNVFIRKKIQKQITKLPQGVRSSLVMLLQEIECYGPVRGNWANFSSLGKKCYHCHIKKGKPTYVAVWEVVDKEIQLVEVSYVGSHEKAPY